MACHPKRTRPDPRSQTRASEVQQGVACRLDVRRNRDWDCCLRQEGSILFGRFPQGHRQLFRRECYRHFDAGRSGGYSWHIPYLLLPNTPLSTAVDYAERIRSQIASAEHKLRNDRISVTVNASVAVLCVSVYHIDAVMKASDKALYRAKSGGRNRVETA
ncbi:GGDEF domain-containing protein [Phyllobacterium calauticae]|uniref:GGDEF domain-containing protein n=1 Tax=Phyllobacterium calauticae TaxID=2817027 RepID=UPI001CBC65B2